MSTRQVGLTPELRQPSAAFGPRLTVRQVVGEAAASAGAVAAYDAPARAALEAMARFVAEFLAGPHPDLGRPGAVCPFAREATGRDLIRLTACTCTDEDAIVEGLGELRGELAALGLWPGTPGVEPHRAIIAVFPRLRGPDDARMIEGVQKSLKLSFVERGMMIGQFYPGCAEPGLWNSAFRPLQAPVISLAMRDITIFDAPFMLERADYVQAFVRAFGVAGAERIAWAEQARGRFGSSPGAARTTALGR